MTDAQRPEWKTHGPAAVVRSAGCTILADLRRAADGRSLVAIIPKARTG